MRDPVTRATQLALLALSLGLSACSGLVRPPDPPSQVNSLGMKFVLIPAGEFLMGSDESPQGLARDFPAYAPRRFLQLGDEQPLHRVRISRPFWLGQHEVTVGQFRAYLGMVFKTPTAATTETRYSTW